MLSELGEEDTIKALERLSLEILEELKAVTMKSIMDAHIKDENLQKSVNIVFGAIAMVGFKVAHAMLERAMLQTQALLEQESADPTT